MILFDEIEKAHPDIFNILLQVLDEGLVTDSLGRKVSFKNTILIMTSNVGAKSITVNQNVGFRKLDDLSEYEEMKEKLLDDIKRVFNPEFINRVSDILVFHALTKEHIFNIIDILLEDTKSRLKEKKMFLELDETAKNYLLEHGYDKNYGARPLKRTIEKLIEDPLAETILEGKVKENNKVVIKMGSKELEFEIK